MGTAHCWGTSPRCIALKVENRGCCRKQGSDSDASAFWDRALPMEKAPCVPASLEQHTARPAGAVGCPLRYDSSCKRSGTWRYIAATRMAQRTEYKLFCDTVEVRAQPLSAVLAHIVRGIRAVLGNQHVCLKTGNGLILTKLYPSIIRLGRSRQDRNNHQRIDEALYALQVLKPWLTTHDHEIRVPIGQRCGDFDPHICREHFTGRALKSGINGPHGLRTMRLCRNLALLMATTAPSQYS